MANDMADDDIADPGSVAPSLHHPRECGVAQEVDITITGFMEVDGPVMPRCLDSVRVCMCV